MRSRFLANDIWGEANPAPQRLIESISSERLVTNDLRMNLNDIAPSELREAIHKLKRGKAAGPDGLPLDISKELDETGHQLILDLLNKWWNGQDIAPDILQAQVVLIYKKSNKADLGNYRPISLLNSLYKLYTSILQKRLSKV